MARAEYARAALRRGAVLGPPIVWLALLLALARALCFGGRALRADARRSLSLVLCLFLGLALSAALLMPVRWSRLPAVVGLQLAMLYPLLVATEALRTRARSAARPRRMACAAARAVLVAAWLPVAMLSFATHRVPGVLELADVGLAWPCERVELVADDGVRLRGLWFPQRAPRGAVLLLHGLGAEKTQFLIACRALRERGYQVLTFDQRNHGESGGLTCTLGVQEARDCEVAWRELLHRAAGTPGPRVLLGVSLGGAAAQLAAPRLPGLDGLVLDSTFADVRRVAARRIPWIGGALVDALRRLRIDVLLTGEAVLDVAPVEAIRAGDRTPVLLLHARRDPLVPFAEAEDLARAYGDRARLVPLDLDGHALGCHGDPLTYRQALLEFAAGL